MCCAFRQLSSPQRTSIGHDATPGLGKQTLLSPAILQEFLRCTRMGRPEETGHCEDIPLQPVSADCKMEKTASGSCPGQPHRPPPDLLFPFFLHFGPACAMFIAKEGKCTLVHDLANFVGARSPVRKKQPKVTQHHHPTMQSYLDLFFKFLRDSQLDSEEAAFL